MPKYNVNVFFSGDVEFQVEAENRDEAEEKAYEHYYEMSNGNVAAGINNSEVTDVYEVKEENEPKT